MAAKELLEPVDIHVALERMLHRRIASLGDGQVDGLGTGELDVGARRVEVRVVGHDLARSADGGEEDLLRGSTLVRRDDVPEGKEVLYGFEEAKPRGGPGVALVAVLDGC